MRAAREDAGLTRAEVAEEMREIGVTVGVVRGWENGRVPGMVEWDVLGRLYGLDAAEAARGIRKGMTARTQPAPLRRAIDARASPREIPSARRASVPYVKFFGGRGLTNAREIVAYADPDAPCREGLAALAAEARLQAEAEFRDPEGRAIATRQYLDDHQYPGSVHLGGVAFVDDVGAHVGADVVTVEEYQTLRQGIEHANAAYRAGRTAHRTSSSDLARRAVDQEGKQWRTRVTVASYVELDHHVPYDLSDGCVAFMRAQECLTTGQTVQVVDLYHDASGGVDSAIHEGADWAETLVDLLAVAGYGAAGIMQVIGTSPPACRIGVPFDISTFGAEVYNTPVRISPGQLTARQVDRVARVALRNLRNGLSEHLPAASFASHWNAMETIADERARDKSRRREVRCPKCGDTRMAGWDLKSGFEEMYREVEGDPAWFDKHRGRRGAIQHGAQATKTDLDATLTDLAQIRGAATVAVSKRVGLRPATSTFLATHEAVAVFTCVATAPDQFSVTFKQVTTHAAPGLLPQRHCGHAPRTIQAGMSMPPKVNPLVLPPLVL